MVPPKMLREVFLIQSNFFKSQLKRPLSLADRGSSIAADGYFLFPIPTI